MDDVHVAALVGSLRDESYTRAALEIALDAAGRYPNVTTDLIDLRAFDLPVYDGDHGDAGDAEALRERVAAADAILVGTPVYHGSYSSTLKTALDYCGFDEFDGKTVGLLAVAGGSFPTATLDHLRSVMRALNAWVLPHQAALPRVRSQFDGDELASDDLQRRVEVLGERAVEYARIEPDPRTFEAQSNVGADD
ncbi:NADPH-dependent FMN reductase [Halorarius litoreus]|uniref:NADPH-dependent FMN reductase n=1 Tax=Halorarius litoreus TaxID=2962676 RepID=UPI0020CD1E21|nr:NAD(P)H-dependent oxidoreductase [Halorarius litoreus]